MRRKFKEISLPSPVLIIDYKGFPVNSFTAEIYTEKGETFDPYFIAHCNSPHAAYLYGFEVLKEAMKADGTDYRLEYTGTLKEFVLRKHFDNPVKRFLYKFYLKIGKLFD